MSQNFDQLDFLLKLLSKDKKAPPKTASQEEISKFILENLNQAQADTLKALMNNPNSTENFLNNPEVQNILNKLKNK